MILLLISTLYFSALSHAEVAVIVNKDNTVELSKGKIKRVFLKKIKTYENGQKISVASLKAGHPVSTQFNSYVLGKTASKLKAYWSKLTFTGKAKPMDYVDTSEEMISKVKADPNMIAYIDASKVTEDVRVLAKF